MMTDAAFADPRQLFRFSVIESLTAIICLACLYTYGVDSGMHVATASATFVFCSMGDLSRRE